MEWIVSLLKTRCPFCGGPLSGCDRVCALCAPRLGQLEDEPPVLTRLGELMVVSAVSYEEWAKSLVLIQKQACRREVVEWMARCLRAKCPEAWLGLPLTWVPGKPWGNAHLVEALALELRTLGQPLARRPLLTRRVGRIQPQKALDVDERRSRDMREVYRPALSRVRLTKEVVLLDDICTTGNTLAGCARILTEHFGVTVRGALSFAATPLQFRRTA